MTSDSGDTVRNRSDAAVLLISKAQKVLTELQINQRQLEELLDALNNEVMQRGES